MGFIGELGRLFFYTFVHNLQYPFIWIVIFLVFMQYRRTAGIESKIYGFPINNYWKQGFISIGFGMVAGIMAGLIMVFLGISLLEIGLQFIWPVAILLLLVNPRYLCFSYAGGIVGIAVLLARAAVLYFPRFAEYGLVDLLLKIHLPAMLVLVGLLHLVEAALIYMGGHQGSSPVYLKKPGGEIAGGFTLQRFWPLPLVALFAMTVTQFEGPGIGVPGWWPLIKSTLQPGPGETILYQMIPVTAALGYTDLALSSTPREKSIFSARSLALYSVILLGLALAAEFYSWLVVAGVLFAPLGHEALIIWANRRELSRKALYSSSAPAKGVGVMMIIPDSPASSAGLREGDLIMRVNGIAVHDEYELLDRIKDSYFLVKLEGSRAGKAFTVILRKSNRYSGSGQMDQPPERPVTVLQRGARLGLIMAPSPRSPVYMEMKRPPAFALLRRLAAKRRTS